MSDLTVTGTRCVCGSLWPHPLPKGVGPWHGPANLEEN
jgi:hypothetical protein